MTSGFGQFCPVAVACEVFAERWTPMILRELLSGAEHFNEIHRGVPLMSRGLLARRLRELEEAGVIEREPLAGKRGYRYKLTPAGEEFRPVVQALGDWGQRWTVRVQRRNLDAGLLMLNVGRRIALERLPDRRVIACFRFEGIPRGYRGQRVFWLILERGGAQVCIDDPGFEVDVQVEADLAAMVAVWLGDMRLETALAAKAVRFMGPRAITSALPGWLMLSPFADVPRPKARTEV